MFSRSNHHDQNRAEAPSTYLAPRLCAGDFLTRSDPLSVHYSRLETLLDSALATLTLIRDYAPTAPALTIHSSEVLRALCRHVPVPALCPQPDTVTPTPTPTPTPSPTPALTSTRATYADVTACPTTDPVATSAVAADRHARTNPRAKPERAKERAHSLAPDLVFWVDSVRAEYNIPAATFTQLHPALLFRSIEGKSAILGDLKLASIWWTVKGNLTFAFHRRSQKRAWTIWDHVCPLLNFPKNCDPNMAITLDTGEPWHNIVIHSVPLPGAVVDGPPLPNIFSWLRRCGVAGEIKTVSFMCSDDDRGKRDKAPLRVSLSSQGDADMLVCSRALILGSQCRVSQYVPKTHSKPHAAPHL
ncbi:hypothetical protein K438DRAFT_1842887, partial [Mycena galopus ATCC 62051]